MILSTTNSLETHPIKDYLGIVSGETIIGANIFKDFFAGIRDIVGGRSGSYEKVLREAKEIALEFLTHAPTFSFDGIEGTMEILDVAIAESWAGMIDVTPDAVPFIGESHDQPGLYILTGLSGHGFGIGPGVGRVMADIVTGRPVGHDLSRFRTSRFADGTPIEPGPY